MKRSLKSAVMSVVSLAVMASLAASAQAADRVNGRAGNAAAAQTGVSQGQLAALGLSGLQSMSAQEGLDVRGSGFFAFRSRHVHKSSISFRGLNTFFRHKFKFVLVTKFRAFSFHGFARINNVKIGVGIINANLGGFAFRAGF